MFFPAFVKIISNIFKCCNKIYKILFLYYKYIIINKSYINNIRTDQFDDPVRSMARFNGTAVI